MVQNESVGIASELELEVNERLTPEQFADHMFDRGEFFLVVWDHDKWRFGKRVKALMMKGYALHGQVFVHTLYKDPETTTKANGPSAYKIPYKQDIGILMYHKGLLEKITGGNLTKVGK